MTRSRMFVHLNFAVAVLLVFANSRITSAGAEIVVNASQQTVTGALSECGDDCDAAVRKLEDRLMRENTQSGTCDIVGTIASTVELDYNAGSISEDVTSLALKSIYSRADEAGCIAVAAAVKQALLSVQSGDPVNFNGLGDGSGGSNSGGDISGSPS